MTNPRLPKLTTTSYAVLGLLRRRPWSAYELTQYMRNSILRAVWPRAESHLYSEPKLLEKRAFVVSHQEQNGARKRTVYSITDLGRRALSEWLLAQRESEFRFEYELLVRFAFAESVDSNDVQGYLQQVRADALRDARAAMLGVEEMLQTLDELKTSDYAVYSGAMIHMVIDQLETRISWAAQMSERFSAAAKINSPAALVEELYLGAEQRLRDILFAED